jgi:hypothetical protein
MSSEDTFTMHISIILLGITIVSGETLLRVGNIKSTISSSLECSKDTTSSSGSATSNIKKSAERTLVLINFINVVSLLSNLARDDLSINLGISLVDIIKSNLLQKTTSDKKSSTVSSSVVLKTYRESVTFKFGGSCLCKDAVSINEGVSNLTDDELVGETYDKTVLGGLVLVLVLGTKTLTLTVVSTSLTATTEFDLETAKVCLALLYLGELQLEKRGNNKEKFVRYCIVKL